MPTASNPDADRKPGANRNGDRTSEAVFLKRHTAGVPAKAEQQGARKKGASRWPSPRSENGRLDRFDVVLAKLRRQLVAYGMPNCTAFPSRAQAMADEKWLLQAAFPECSGSRDRCGAGHATVAGAYVTIIKAFAEMHEFARRNTISGAPENVFCGGALKLARMIADAPALFEMELALAKGMETPAEESDSPSLAATPSIGREWIEWRCHFDHYKSLRLGERIAVAILQEELLASAVPLAMRFTSFDDDWIMLAGIGDNPGTGDGSVPQPVRAQLLVWPYHDRAPSWTQRSYASDKFKAEAAREARKWWNRGQDDGPLQGN